MQLCGPFHWLTVTFRAVVWAISAVRTTGAPRAVGPESRAAAATRRRADVEAEGALPDVHVLNTVRKRHYFVFFPARLPKIASNEEVGNGIALPAGVCVEQFGVFPAQVSLK